MSQPSDEEPIGTVLIEDICDCLAAGKSVRRKLPGGGLLNFDRPLPFMCVYRRDTARQDAGTRKFVGDQAAYLSLPGGAATRKGLARLVRRLAETATARFGAFFMIEIWSSPDEDVPRQKHPVTGELLSPAPQFRIHERAPVRPGPSVNELMFALKQIQLQRQEALVEVLMRGIAHPPSTRQLIANAAGLKINCFVVGLEILPVWRDLESGDVYPDILRQLCQGVGVALKRAFFTFALRRTNTRPQHYYALGRHKLAKLVWDVDHELAEIGMQSNLLLQATPVNVESSWQEFEASGFAQEPFFHYRPLAVDPLLLKRRVNLVRTERIADATMAHLLRQTQDELDRMVTMLGDIGTPRFVHGGVQVFGGVEPSLLQLAEQLLERMPVRRSAGTHEGHVGAKAFTTHAAREIRAYRRQNACFAAHAEIRDDLYSGLMTSEGNLLIGRETSLPAHRVEALIAHEIGTHLVTYYNGQAQPLRLLSTGLAGYDALQEGLAVFSEYLVGGLSRGRMRMLAARVLASDRMLRGVPFSETFRLLAELHGFDSRAAYTITMRVYRGGGLTKDAVYLRGLVEILDYLAGGGDLPLLFTGKLAVDHVPIIRELLYRNVLCQPPLTPRHLSSSGAQQRLARARQGLSVLDLIAIE